MARQYPFSGESGECVFAEPFMEWTSPVQELPLMIQRIDQTGDDRSLVILTQVVVERYLDELMSHLAPGFARLAENRDFTFSLKLALLRALRLIPRHILKAADLVRRVRNDFAHDLDTENLAGCSATHKNAMRTLEAVS